MKIKLERGNLVAIAGCSQSTEDKWLDAINSACEQYGIDTRLRLAAFLGNVLHESNRLESVSENLNYSHSGLLRTWPSRFNETTAREYSNKPEKIGSLVYANRMGNDNEASGDGWKYRGRGLIQCTGKAQYDAYSQACGINAIARPELLETTEHAALSAAWFWNSKGLNAYADRADFLTITKRINGGTIGLADREMLYKKALIVLDGKSLPRDEEVIKNTKAEPDATAPITEEKAPAASNSSIVEPRTQNANGGSTGGSGGSQYPWNLVFESRSGHLTEIDDTPGNERLSNTHRSGTYWEIDSLGTITHKSVLDAYKLSKGDSYDYTGGSYTQQVKGQTYRQSDGNMIFKTGSNFFINANKVQVNTGAMNVSGEINAPNVNAPLFAGHGGMAFGDMLAKEAVVAYDIKSGKAPMLGGAIGFTGPGGSAEGMTSNSLASKAPNGTPWITNGIKNAIAPAIGIAAAATAIKEILENDPDIDPRVAGAMTSAASDLDTQASLEANQTPMFLKHVSFDKPTLLSQSIALATPDPKLYVNNYHTIVRSDGIGQLHMSDGEKWIPVGDDAATRQYTDEKHQEAIGMINQEALDRVDAIRAEALERQDAILTEARERQEAIRQGILEEAIARRADIQAESEIIQDDIQSLATHVTEITSSMSDDIASAFVNERTAWSDAVSAEATERDLLAAIVNDNVATIESVRQASVSGDEAITTRIDNYIASNDNALATAKTEIIAKVDADNNTLSQRIDTVAGETLTAAGVASRAMVNQEATTRTSELEAVGSRIDTVIASVGDNTALIANLEIATTNQFESVANTFSSVSAEFNTKVEDTKLEITTAYTAAMKAEMDKIANDNLLTRGEKSAVILSYTTIINERTGLEAQATNFGITTEKTAYSNAVNALTSYLTGLSPSYSDLTKDTPIVGTTFRTKFTDVYSTLQTLLNLITDRVKGIADSKAKVTRASTAPTGPAVGDIWIDISGGQNVTKVWSGSAWQEADYRIAKNSADIISERTARADAISAYASTVDTVVARLESGSSTFEPYMTWDFKDSKSLGWLTESGSVITPKPSFLEMSMTANGGRIRCSDISPAVSGEIYNTVRVRLRRKSGTGWNPRCEYKTTTRNYNGSYRKDVPAPQDLSSWTIVEWDFTSLTAGGSDYVDSQIMGFKFWFGQTAADVYEIDWISLGRKGVGVPTTELAQIQQTMSSQADEIGNVKAQWGISANVNGQISGVDLISNIIDGQASSKFSVLADRFEIVHPGSTGASPFFVQNGKVVVNGMDMADLSIFEGKIANGAITNIKIGDAAITNAKIENGAITNAKIGNLQVDNAKIANGTITSAKIGDAQITNAKIGNAAVNTLEIAGNAVTIPVGASSGTQTLTNNQWNTVCSCSVASSGGPIMINAINATLLRPYATGDSSAGVAMSVRLLRNGSQLRIQSDDYSLYDRTQSHLAAFCVRDHPGSGSINYQLQVLVSVSGGPSAPGITSTSTQSGITLLEVKR